MHERETSQTMLFGLLPKTSVRDDCWHRLGGEDIEKLVYYQKSPLIAHIYRRTKISRHDLVRITADGCHL